MDFRILGPLEVVEDDRPVRLDRRRLRALLAYLLLHANTPVSSDQLIDEVWGPMPPKTAGASLQNYVSRLRKAIGGELIVSQPAGYLLKVDPEHFDLARFERLVLEARRAEPRERAEKLRAALSLWRGRALEDLAFEPFAQPEIARLEEARLGALEGRLDADLALSRAAELITELEELVEQHPLREHFRAQLMLALYRTGRQADALIAYQEARRVLLDELGLEPSEEVRALERAILRQDPTLFAGGDARAERPPDRRSVTVLFCDLVDSTGLAASVDPEVYRVIMERYFAAVRAPIERHGGTVEKFVGGAVMAVFGVPKLHEDDALRAARAAVEIRSVLEELDELATAEWDVRLAGRIGVDTGEVHVFSAPGEDLRLSGAAVSAAAKLEKQASPGAILFGENTHRLVLDTVKAEQVELTDGRKAWRLEVLVPDASPYTQHLDAPQVGRDVELGRLRGVYANTCAEKRCRVVTIVGEAGIGKTRLARELVAPLRAEARVLVGRCVSYGEGATYLPISEIVKDAASEYSLTGIRALVEGEDDAEVIAGRVAELVGLAESPAAPGEAFWAVRRLLESLARKQPIVVALDDIHWAEPTLLDLVEYLGEWAEGPILVVCLARGDLLDTRPGWGGPTSTGFVVELQLLPNDTLNALVDHLADGAVGPDLRARIAEYSGGNPLFAEQLLALAAEAPELTLEVPPSTVEMLLATRLDHLDPRELHVLRRAAVLGRRFSRAELEDLTIDDDVERQLASLAGRGLVYPADNLFRFHHPLMRDVAYRGIPKAERAELHERAAEGLERRGGADELVGYHFEQAYRCVTQLRRPGEHASKLAKAGGDRLGGAGIRAWKRADAPAAVNLLSRAVDLMPGAQGLACELGSALRTRYEFEKAAEILERATQAPEPRIAYRARIELAFLRSLGEADKSRDLLAVATEAIPIFEAAGDDRGLGRAWLSIAHVKGGFDCEYGVMEDAAIRAAAHYQRSGWSPSSVLDNVGSALYNGPKPVIDAIAQAEELLQVHQGDRTSIANIEMWLGPLKAMLGLFEEARAYVGRASHTFKEFGLTVAVQDTCGRLSAAIDLLAGSPATAERPLRLSCEILEEMNQNSVLATRAGELAGVLYTLGRYAESEVWTRTARDCAGSDDIDAALAWQPIHAMLLARQGALNDGEALARQTVDLVARTDAVNRHADSLLALAEVLRLGGRQEAFGTTVRSAVDLYEQKGNVAAAALARALLAEAALTE